MEQLVGMSKSKREKIQNKNPPTGRAEEQPTSSCLKSKEISDDGEDTDDDDGDGEDGAQEKPLVAEEQTT